MEDTTPPVKEHLEVQHREEIKIALIGISDCQYSNARNNNESFPIEAVSTNNEFLVETLIEEMKSVVMGDKCG